MKTAITLFAIVGMTALPAYAAPAVDQAPAGGVPMSVAKRLNAAPTFDGTTIAAERSGVPMRAAARTNPAVQAPQASAAGATDILLSGVRVCHAKRT
jgi:hypothetical protein